MILQYPGGEAIELNLLQALWMGREPPLVPDCDGCVTFGQCAIHGPPPMSSPIVFSYSASQLETFADCPRKWGFEKIEGLSKPPSKSAELGEAIHTQLENHLLGKGLDFSVSLPAWTGVGVSAELAATALHLLPPPGTVQVESKFDRVKLGGNLFTGRIDWLHNDPEALVIGDHKSTSDIRAWSKSAEVLRGDIQANIYAKYALDILRPDLDRVHLQWTYIQTKGPRLALPVTLTLSRPEVDSRFAEIDAQADVMTEARAQVSTALELPFNADACEKYGGCPFQGKCNLSPLHRMKSVMSQGSEMFSKLSQFQQSSGGPAMSNFAPPSFAAPVAAPAAFTPPNRHQGLSAMAKRNAQGQVTHSLEDKALPPIMVATQYVKDPNGQGYRPIDPMDGQIAEWMGYWGNAYQANPDAFGQPPGATPAPAPVAAQAPFAPPGFTPPPAPQAAPIAPPAAWTPPGMAAPPAFQQPAPSAAPQINPPEWQPPPVAAAPQAPPAAPEAPAKRGPGRPKKATTEATAAPAPAPMAWTPPGAPVAPVGNPNPPTPAPEAGSPMTKGEGIVKGLTLYVNCIPVRGGGMFHSLDTIIAECAARIAAEEGLADYAFADWGKGSGILACYVDEAVRSLCESGPISLTMDSRTREGLVLTTTLTAMSETVIRGV